MEVLTLQDMKVEELQALARAVQPITAIADGHHVRESVAAYNGLVSRFRELVTRALNNLLLRQVIEPELEQELRLLAKALPGARCGAESAARREAPGLGRAGVTDEA